MMTTVIHGFEPVRHDLDNRGLVSTYRAAGRPVGRVVVREALGEGMLSSARLSMARISPGRDDRGTEPAEALLARLAHVRRPRNLEEATSIRRLRELCREAIDVLGPDAGILHGTHCRAA